MTELLRGAICPVPVASLRIGVMPEMEVGIQLSKDYAAAGSDAECIVDDEQPAHPSGAVRRVGPHDGARWFQVDLPYVGDWADDINVVAMPGPDFTEAAIGVIAPDGTLLARHTVTTAPEGLGLLLGQLIRRDGVWSFRAVGDWLKPDDATEAEPSTPPPATGASFEPYTVTGRGKDVITAPAGLPPGPVIVELQADDNKGYTSVHALDRSNNRARGLFSDSSGRKARHRAIARIPVHGRLRLLVDDDRSWTLRILPLSAAERLDGLRKGRGHEVYLYDGPLADLRFSAEGYHWIRVYANADTGKYKSFSGEDEETAPLPPGRLLVTVDCEKEWEIEAVPVEGAESAGPEAEPEAEEEEAPPPLYAGSDDVWPFAPFEPFTAEHRGEQVVTAPGGLPNGPVMVEFEASGKKSYTKIYSLNRWHRDDENLLSSEVKNPCHRFLAEEPSMRRLRMRVSDHEYETEPRPWTLRILPLTAAPRLGATPRHGHGNAVFLYSGPLADLRLRTTGGGDQYVYVRAYENGDTSESGTYHGLISGDGGGTAPLPACKVLLTVKTDAHWTIEARPVVL
ncbi:hypothetical protein [Streptomyces qinzhouensis]|uniref:hypothetical protein n=1 Tax=Streptomyces qinzhouensis TaxID=2599401 RepID=UPI0016486FBA|nr:hypothetical protein [Streptomyces qinzhouensis]